MKEILLQNVTCTTMGIISNIRTVEWWLNYVVLWDVLLKVGSLTESVCSKQCSRIAQHFNLSGIKHHYFFLFW